MKALDEYIHTPSIIRQCLCYYWTDTAVKQLHTRPADEHAVLLSHKTPHVVNILCRKTQGNEMF